MEKDKFCLIDANTLDIRNLSFSFCGSPCSITVL